MELLPPALFSCVYRRVKLLVFAMNSRRRYSIFTCYIYGKELKIRNYLCRLPSVVNVMLILSIKHFQEVTCCHIRFYGLQPDSKHTSTPSEKNIIIILKKQYCNSDEIVESMVCFKLSIVAFVH